MRRAYTTLPDDKAFTIWFSMAPLRPLPDMAFSLQSEIYLAAYVPWEDSADDEARVGWLESVMADLEPVTVGQYLGDSDLSRRQVKFLSDASFQRLQEIRAERDPDGLFVGYLAGPGGATNRNHWEAGSAGRGGKKSRHETTQARHGGFVTVAAQPPQPAGGSRLTRTPSPSATTVTEPRSGTRPQVSTSGSRRLTPTTAATPAARAAATPGGLSSNTTHASAGTPRRVGGGEVGVGRGLALRHVVAR